MFSTRKSCLIRIPIWGYQNFYSLPPKNWILGPKTVKFGPKLAFWAKYWHFWPTWSNAWQKNNADKLPKWFSVMLIPKLLLNPIKIRIFGPKKAKCGIKYAFFVIFGPKSLIFMGISKSFGTNITENHFGNLSALFFGHALDQVGQKCQYLAQNASFGPNLAVFGPKIQFFGGRE